MNSLLAELNLARKWRPKTFDEIVGQETPVRMLKNGLFLKKIFPVYLFAGQRGCGKTSTARVFAAAVNCFGLENFQQDPTISLPCLSCESCSAMRSGHHPDFIEIDAASHTGVDNVRQIIDSSSYMPFVGKKKIYLIDEAHMLSKAAFNAFLKILEEPPVSVLFILATTEIQKIPQTVLSRCLQIIFTSIESANLKNHLIKICEKEEIIVDETAFDLLLAETEGSARDAINLLERVRFSCTHITEKTILSVLGKISNQELYTLFDLALDKKAAQLLEYLHSLTFEVLSPQIVWDMLIQLCRTLLLIKYNATASLPSHIKNDAQLNLLARKCSMSRLYAISQIFWTQDDLFFKTNKKRAFLEMVLLQMCAQVNLVDLEPLLRSYTAGAVGDFFSTQQGQSSPIDQLSSVEIKRSSIVMEKTKSNDQSLNTFTDSWGLFIKKIADSDALLNSIFAQAKLIGPHENNQILIIELSSGSKFFKDKLDECKKKWLPLFISFFPHYQDVIFQDPVQLKTNQQLKKHQPIVPMNVENHTSNASIKRYPLEKVSFGDKKNVEIHRQNKNDSLEAINIDDNDKWPLATLLMSHFPGKLRKIKD
jgi:DNA polymerase-3 subunit gamma/tau